MTAATHVVTTDYRIDRYTNDAGIDRVTVAGKFGYYVSDADLFDAAMARTVADLRTEVLERGDTGEAGYPTRIRSTRKAVLAGMVADWNTGSREQERSAIKTGQRIAAQAAERLHAPTVAVDLASEAAARAERDAKLANVTATINANARAEKAADDARREAEALARIADAVEAYRPAQIRPDVTAAVDQVAAHGRDEVTRALLIAARSSATFAQAVLAAAAQLTDG